MATHNSGPWTDLSAGQSVPLWALLINREKIELPKEASLEDWASKVDTAVLIRGRLAK
jgi:hypothetical protein